MMVMGEADKENLKKTGITKFNEPHEVVKLKREIFSCCQE